MRIFGRDLLNGDPVDQHLTAVAADELRDEPRKRGLAGADAADDGQRTSGRDAHADVHEGRLAVVGEEGIAELDLATHGVDGHLRTVRNGRRVQDLGIFAQDGLDAHHGRHGALVAVHQAAQKHHGSTHAQQESVEGHEGPQTQRAIHHAPCHRISTREAPLNMNVKG